jgi:hypothetical protein
MGIETVQNRTFRYEVMISHEGRWIIRNVYTEEHEALSHARSMVHTERMAEAIRVVQHRTAPNGFSSQKELLTIDRLEAYRRQEFQVGKVEEVEFCEDVNGLFKLDARRAMEKLLRPYLGVQSLTPTEFLHITSYHREIDRQGRLVESALHAIARLQAEKLKLKTADRQKELELMAREVQQLAQDFTYEAKSLPRIDGSNFKEVASAIEAQCSPEKVTFFTTAAVCLYLMQHRAMMDKLERLVSMLSSSDRRGIAIMDSLFADAISSPGLMKDILGPQISLAEHINLTHRVLKGEYGVDGEGGARFLIVVSHLISAGVCPETAEALRLHMVRAFASETPLDRRETDPSTERKRLEAMALSFAEDAALEPSRAEINQAIERRRRRLRSEFLRSQGLEELADRSY